MISVKAKNTITINMQCTKMISALRINSKGCPACWHRSHIPAGPAHSGILPYPPIINPKPSGTEFPKTTLTSGMCYAVDPNTLSSGLLTPLCELWEQWVVGVAQLWLINCWSKRVKKENPKHARLRRRARVCVSVSRSVSAWEWQVPLFLKTAFQSEACAAELACTGPSQTNTKDKGQFQSNFTDSRCF